MPNEKWKCPKCGAENAMDDNFCGECGTKRPEVKAANSGIGMAGKAASDKANLDSNPAQTENYLRQATDNKGNIEQRDEGYENEKNKRVSHILGIIVNVLWIMGLLLYIFSR